MRARFDGDAQIPDRTLDVSFPPYTIQIEADEDHRVLFIAVQVKVEDYKGLLPSLTHPSEDSSHLTYPPNPIHDDLLGLMQYLESVGAFWLGVHRIDWERSEVDWLPESDAERQELVVWNLRVKKEYPTLVKNISVETLQTLIARREFHSYLTIPLAFYREGKNEFRQFRYVQAFMNFYFMIEGLFGAGRPNYRVVEHFHASPTLMQAATEAIEHLRADERHWGALEGWLPKSDRVIDAKTVLAMLVALRGRLHHYSLRDSRKQAHPLNQREFESVAYLAMAVCIKLMPRLIGTTEPPPELR